MPNRKLKTILLGFFKAIPAKNPVEFSGAIPTGIPEETLGEILGRYSRGMPLGMPEEIPERSPEDILRKSHLI